MLSAVRRPRTGKGAALILALAAIVIVGALGAAITAVILGGMKATRAAATRDELLNTAESGAEAAISQLASSPEWRGAKAVKVPGGECRVSVAPEGGGRFEITSRASNPRPGGRDRARAVVMVVEKDATGRFRVVGWRLVPGGGG